MTDNFAMYQIIILFISSLLILRTIILLLQRKKSFRELMIALLVWGTFWIIGYDPQITSLIAKITGFEVGINAILTITVILLAALSMSLLLKTDKMENSITRLIRQQALEKFKEKYVDKSQK